VPSDFRLLEPSNKHLAGKQFATDVNVKQVVTCLTQLTMQKMRNSERMTSPKGYIAYIVEEGITEKLKKNKIVYPLLSNTKNLIFLADMRLVLCEVGTHYFYI
jgi:hypothetical protein